MKISVFGLGYVGCVSAACLAKDGHHVIGVDINEYKVDLIKSGRSPIHEPDLDKLISGAVLGGYLQATSDSLFAVHQSDLSLICVGTPGNHNGRQDLHFIENVCVDIGNALRTKNGFHVVVIRSTVLPGTIQEKLIPILEQSSGLRVGIGFAVCMNPEFMREGSAIEDFYHPGFIIIGEMDSCSGDIVERIYSSVDAPVLRISIPTAEVAKYVSNAFHALKVVFANEIGNYCKSHRVDGQEVMEIFCRDHRLNISPSYLKPGFAFGGSCLPKDVRALIYNAKERDIDAPLLTAIMQSNQMQIQRGIDLVERTGYHKIGVLGLSFKPRTDDVRESPTISLIETLIGRGYEVSVYDEVVDSTQLIGANRAFLERELPHIASLMWSSLEYVVNNSEVIVITNASASFRQVPGMIGAHQTLIDLVGIAKDNDHTQGIYEGICW